MKIVIEKGQTFIIELESGLILRMTHAEWMELRRIQNMLIYTEPAQ